MKKVRFLTMAVLFLSTALLFSSCSKSKMNEKRIVGNWRITQVYVNNVNYSSDYNNEVWKFQSNGVCFSSFMAESSNVSGTYNVNGDLLQMYSDYLYSYNYAYNYTYWYKYSMNLNIIELNRNDMMLEGHYYYYDADGDAWDESVIINFKKVN